MNKMKDYLVDELLNNPLNLCLVIVLGFITLKPFFKSSQKPINAVQPKVVELRNLTPVELSAFNGRNG